jgi:hypothetical protein
MNKAAKPILQLIALTRIPDSYCFWCEQALTQCGMCKGSGLYKGSDCKICNGQGRICPTHEGDWTP